MMETITFLQLLTALLVSILGFVLCKKGYIPKFMPKTFEKIIDQNTPRYYDLKGNLIKKPDKKAPQEPPQVKEEPKPDYDFQADTTATITMKGEEYLKKVEVEEVPEQVLEQATPSVIPVTEKAEPKKEYNFYCTCCKKKTPAINVKLTKTKNGLMHGKGNCQFCKTNTGSFLKG